MPFAFKSVTFASGTAGDLAGMVVATDDGVSSDAEGTDVAFRGRSDSLGRWIRPGSSHSNCGFSRSSTRRSTIWLRILFRFLSDACACIRRVCISIDFDCSDTFPMKSAQHRTSQFRFLRGVRRPPERLGQCVTRLSADLFSSRSCTICSRNTRRSIAGFIRSLISVG